ncbi:MAG: ZPR1 zinc finger domain-containing protein [Desulfurococcales archaeon]|nr:ZPR1 zinc finger domain-containing protein [Desulfurococcales archaeon]
MKKPLIAWVNYCLKEIPIESRLLQKILGYEITCPICRHNMVVEEFLYELPLVGKVLIASGTCKNCGYRYVDVRLAEPREPRRIIYRVEKPGDENTVLIRASTAGILIPDVGVEIIPGPAARGYITTIEGLILDIIEKTEFLCSSPDADKEKCKEKLEELEAARDARKQYTVIIVDPEGVSAILSEKAKIEKLRQDRENNTVK